VSTDTNGQPPALPSPQENERLVVKIALGVMRGTGLNAVHKVRLNLYMPRPLKGV
jgi:hypothetical protein